MPSRQITSGGAPYFTLAEARKVSPLGDAALYPDADIQAAREAAEEALEDKSACNAAFVPRTATETVNGNGHRKLRLERFHVRSVTSVTLNGTALDVSDIQIDGRTLYRPGGWAAGIANVEVVYEHGYDQPPFRVKRAALRLTKHFLVESGINDQATRAEAGDERLWLAEHAPFGILEVDAAVRDHKHTDGSLV